MIFRLQDFLIDVAAANGVPIKGDWPFLEDFIRWVIDNCRAQTADTACALFAYRKPGTRIDDYWGINGPSLTTRIMTLLYSEETLLTRNCSRG